MKLKVTVWFKDSDKPLVSKCDALVVVDGELKLAKGLWFPYDLEEIEKYQVQPCEEES